MRIFVTGSIAYDYIMVFPGRFQDHILPDKMHVLSVSFLVDSLTRLRGGTGANISFNLLKAAAEGLPVGPILLGMSKPIHVVVPSVTARGIVNLSALAVVEAQEQASTQAAT